MAKPLPTNRKKLMVTLLILAVLIAAIVIGIGLGYLLFQARDSQPDRNNRTSPTPTDTVTPTSSPSPTPTDLAPAQTPVTIYFFSNEKFQTPDTTDYLKPVVHQTNRLDVATYAIEQIISGPTSAEAQGDLRPTFGTNTFVSFTSASNCNGKDFRITLADKTATVQFCRQTMMAGDMSGFIVTDQIERTLKQFSTINKVVVLNQMGNCFDDLSGLDTCKQ